MKKTLDELITGLPKAELHVHIEGTLEPELMFKIARRNEIKTEYNSVEALKSAYNFNNLQEFLDIYYQGANVLLHEVDFFDMTWAYLLRANTDNVVHTEIFFDPQTHTQRGVSFETVITGINKALKKAENELNLSTRLIMCFLRDLSEESALETLKSALPFKSLITAVGLDSAEVGNPPSKFTEVFKIAREAGFLTVAHAGEEGPSEYVREALQHLRVSRIDHGNRSLEDVELTDMLVKSRMPLTVCPLSNLKLKVVQDMKAHPLKKMLELGLVATVNSDDPAYFCGHINDNYRAVAQALELTNDEIIKLARNSFEASFISHTEKTAFLNRIDVFLNHN